MRIKFLYLILLVGAMVSAVSADMYFWVDENGVKHFTDRPPERSVDKSAVKQYATPDFPFNHRLYRKEGDYEYCGNYKLPDANSGPKIQLVNAMSQYKHTLKLRRDIRDQILTAPTASAEANYRKRMEQNDCIIEWTQRKTQSLDSTREQIIKDARLAQKEYDEIKRRCGEEPKPGIHTDQEALDWVKCQKKTTKLHNKLLNELKRKTAMEKSLRSAMEAD